ncbi:MAG: hypothetical protein EXR21_09405 [Flavobacteriaceae bacterium]|nr:hypothetical protein [Flavobacteriaceae bacterium]
MPPAANYKHYTAKGRSPSTYRVIRSRCDMMDVGGRVVLSQTCTSRQLQLNTAQLAMGCYVLKIVTLSGGEGAANETKVAKVVVR